MFNWRRLRDLNQEGGDNRAYRVLRSTLHAQHKIMHRNDLLFAIDVDGANSIKPHTVRRCFSHPFPLIQPLEISIVNDGELSARERNKTVRFRGRHNSLYTQVGHSQSSQTGLMCRHFTLRGSRHAF